MVIIDTDPVDDFDPALGSEVSIEGVRSFLQHSGTCTVDHSLPNFGCIPQLIALDWFPETVIPLANGNNLTIPESELNVFFNSQTPLGDLIFEDGFESGDTSAWSVNPTFDVTMTGTLTIFEPGVIPASQPASPSIGGATSFLDGDGSASAWRLASVAGAVAAVLAVSIAGAWHLRRRDI